MQTEEQAQLQPVIRVALVEDDANFQAALVAAIESAPDMCLQAMASTRAMGLKMLKEPTKADVLLVDLGLPDGSGIDVIRAAQQHWPECSVMVSTAFGDESHVMQSIEAGAAGYLLKDSAPQKMLAEIRSLHAGGSPISPLIARQVLMRFRGDRSEAPELPVKRTPVQAGATLSSREVEVLEFITKGFTANEIAALLGVSFHTVHTYIRRIYSKLEVNSRTEAVYEARNQGLLPNG